MAWAVIHDIEQDTAALIDPDAGRALGPVAGGNGAIKVLEDFAATVGVDPSTLADWDLQARWKEWMLAGQTIVKDADGTEHKFGALVHDITETAEEVADGIKEAVDPTNAAGTSTVDSKSDGPSGSADVAADHDPAALKPRLPILSGGESEGHAICPTCDGWGQTVTAGVTKTCSTCNGLGQLPIEAHAGTTGVDG